MNRLMCKEEPWGRSEPGTHLIAGWEGQVVSFTRVGPLEEDLTWLGKEALSPGWLLGEITCPRSTLDPGLLGKGWFLGSFSSPVPSPSFPFLPGIFFQSPPFPFSRHLRMSC